MIDSSVMRAVGEVLETHGVTPSNGEALSATVARVLDLSDAEVQRWAEALSEGCPVEEANRRAGIASHRGDEAILVAIARAIGKAAGKIAG